MRLILVGTGRAARSLGRALGAAGHPVVGVLGRTAARAQRLADRLGAAALEEGRPFPSAEAVLVAVSDDAVASVGLRLAPWAGAGKLWLHLSGSLPAAVLDPAAARAGGGLTLSWHPLAVLDGRPRGLRGRWVALEGSPAAVAQGRLLAEDLGARVLPLRPEAKLPYHLAASLAAGHLVALVGLAQEVARAGGLPEELLPALAGLAVEGARAAGRRGPAATLTGPVVRRDLGVVTAHLDWLEGRRMGLTRQAYGILGEAILRLSGLEAKDPSLAAVLHRAARREAAEGSGSR